MDIIKTKSFNYLNSLETDNIILDLDENSEFMGFEILDVSRRFNFNPEDLMKSKLSIHVKTTKDLIKIFIEFKFDDYSRLQEYKLINYYHTGTGEYNYNNVDEIKFVDDIISLENLKIVE